MSQSTDLRRRGLIAVALSLVATIAVFLVAQTIEVAPGFQPLSLPRVGILTIAGAGGAAVVYWWLGARVGDPDRTFTRLAAVVLLLSFLPDFGLLYGDPAATVAGVGTLMLMHVLVAAICVRILTGSIRW